MQELSKKLQAQFDIMCATGKLFRSNVPGSKVWETYLESFPPELNPVFRAPDSTTHNCNLCNNFIRRYGNIIAINSDGNIISIFSDLGDVGEYNDSVAACYTLLEDSQIQDVFFETYNSLQSLPYESCSKTNTKFRLGIEKNVKRYTKEEAELYGVVKPNEIRKFYHMHLDLPKQFVDMSGNSIEQVTAFYRDKYSVFKRAMEEIPLDTLILVKDLINQGSLLDGTAHLHVVQEFIQIMKKQQLESPNRSNSWYWVNSYALDERVAKFKNTLIGTLCSEIAEGLELNKACENWNKRVDPINYHKASAPITKKQIEEAKKFVQENGYEESFNRRLVTLDDIKASEILHMNSGDGKVKELSIFDTVKPSGSGRHKRSEFDKVEEVSIDKFMKDILPGCSSVELFLENRMQGNLVTMTKSIADSAKQITKWNGIATNYSWTFNGNLAGKSMIKDAVKSRGGNVDSIVRVSLFFPDTTDDYDLHLIEPNRHIIYYQNLRKRSRLGGMLDLDAQGVDGHQSVEKRVENITYADKSLMTFGNYVIRVHNYSGRGLHTKFKLEIEIEGEITVLELKNKIALNRVNAVTIQYTSQGFNIIPSEHIVVVSSNSISKNLWNIETNQFHKVNLVCKSPNHWGNNEVGNLHYMFMLDGCKTDTPVRGFHNENLLPELLKHRKVLEVLGNSSLIEPTEQQLSGVGFNATVKDEAIVKLQGTHKRMLKIKF